MIQQFHGFILKSQWWNRKSSWIIIDIPSWTLIIVYIGFFCLFVFCFFFWYETTSCTFCFVFHLDDCSHRTIKMHLMFDQSVIFFVLIIHKTSLNPSLFIEMSVSSRTNGRSCICVLGVSILPLSTIYLLDFRTVPTVWCVLLFIFHQPRYRPSDKIKT